MRTNIVIDDHLMGQALKAGPFRTKKEAVEEGLKLIIRLKGQQKIKKAKGRLRWDANLEEMRLDK